MADLDALMREITPGLMLWHAQSITALEIKNEVADVADLCTRIATAIDTADITIELEG